MTRLINADLLIELLPEIFFIREESIQHIRLKFIINSLPTVDAVPVRHGKFIGTEFDGYSDGNPVYYEWKCSECGCVFEDDEPTYNYCPNCGARMDEE